MTPAEYVLLKDTYLDKIRAHISDPNVEVAVLKEAPEKPSFGDIDIFVGLDKELDPTALARAVGACGLIVQAPGKYTLGVLQDATPSAGPVIEYCNVYGTTTAGRSIASESTPEEYAQIDLEVVPTTLVEWHVFYSSYSDLNGLLGHIVTNLGFTITDLGLWLRMKELDTAKKIERANVSDDHGKVFLSREPSEVMRFLGLSVAKWDAGFATLDDFYEWLGECRMIHAVSLKLWRDKAHERKREQNRDVYRKFFSEWLPGRMPSMAKSYEPEEQKLEIAQLRQQYLDDALDFFSKRSIYEEKHRTITLIMHNALASHFLRPIVVQQSGAVPKKTRELMRAFRRFVRFDKASQPYLARTALTDSESQMHLFLDEEAQRLSDQEAIEQFVRSNWEEAKELERARAKKTTDGEAAREGEES